MPRSFLIANKRYGGRRLATRANQLPDVTDARCCHHDDEASHENESDEETPLVAHKSPSDVTATETDPDAGEKSPPPFLSFSASHSHTAHFSSRTLLPLRQNGNISSHLSGHNSPIDDGAHFSPIVSGFVRQCTAERFYSPMLRGVIPAEAQIFQQTLHRQFLPTTSTQTDINFNRLNELVDKVFDGLRVCDIYTCNTCGKQYSTPSNLARHKQIHRDVTDKKARKCPHCEKVYVSMPAFSMHVRTHNEGCACPYCGKRFSRPWLLQGHIRTHTGEKPFRCTLCTKAFADKSNLRAHVQTHSSEKPYVCGRCGKAFALKSYLSKHEESSCMKGLKYHKLSCAFSQRNN